LDVVVVDVVIFVMYGTGELGFGAAFARATAPTTAMPARELTPKSLSIMDHSVPGDCPSDHPHLGHEIRAPSVQFDGRRTGLACSSRRRDYGL
jgi:hypothetical protein